MVNPTQDYEVRSVKRNRNLIHLVPAAPLSPQFVLILSSVVGKVADISGGSYAGKGI